MSSVAAPKLATRPHPVATLQRALEAVLLFVFGIFILSIFWLASKVKRAVIRAWVGAVHWELLSPMDAMMLIMKPERFTDQLCPTTITHATSVRGKVNLWGFCRMVEERLLGAREEGGAKKFPNLTKRVVQKYGYYMWEEDKDFSVDNHVHLHKEGYGSTASLVQLMQALQLVPLLKHRPLWEILLVPKTIHELPAGEEEYTLILRIHHAMADGNYTMLMMTEICDQDNSSLLPDFNKVLEHKLPKLIQDNALLRYMAMPNSTELTLKNVINITGNLLEIMVMIPWYAAESMFYKEENNALSLSSPVLSGRKLMAVSDKLDLQLFKDIAMGNHCTINDVLLRCVTEALRRTNAEETVAMDCSVRVMLPMFLLPPSSSMQNGVSIFPVVLPLQDATNSLECLRSISDICQNKKTSLAPLCNRLTLTAVVNCLPSSLATRMLFQQSYTMAVSNICGPATRVSLMGEDIVDTFFMLPSSGMCAVSVGLLSYNEQVRISALVDKMVAPNDNTANQLITYTTEELKNLHEATKTLKKETKQ